MLDYNADFMSNSFGVVLPQVEGILEQADYSMAMDAQSPLVTTANQGIPAFLTNWIDPQLVRVLTTPNKGAQILGEVKKGDWTDQTAQFPIIENTGEVSSYGDFNENGMAGVNVNWEPRESYLFQTFTQWGELELDRAGRAKLNYAAELNTSAAMTLDKFMNASYFYGVAGLKNYGILNDPSLQSAITPATKTKGGVLWSNADAVEVYNDLQALYTQLVSQTKGLVDVDENSKMTLAMSPTIKTNLKKANMYNVSVEALLRENFPNLRIETAVQYDTTGGQLVQLIVDDIQGQETGYCAFNEKMRAHPVIRGASSFRQKKTGGTWGAIIKQPLAIAQLLGV